MRIRTRYTLFKVIAALAVLVFVASLYDMFQNASEWFIPIMVAYVVLALFALLLYLGYKPDLEEEAAQAMVAAPEPISPQDVVEEVAPPPTLDVKVSGAHHFRCPFCSNTFALELTHLRKVHELRMDCPFCSNTIRIPRNPKLSPGLPVDLSSPAPAEQALFVCENCGEFLRYTAPGQRAEDRARVHTCPHCGSEQVDPAVGAAA
ncbi:MAG TPA: hypothetical protein VI818_07485 [Candidatus Thermoplasmatota archaeon]|nr:hypothetical protein [Candidatus Thermoplasmatota archaeon]